jgi:hypothetical protein
MYKICRYNSLELHMNTYNPLEFLENNVAYSTDYVPLRNN